MITSGRCHGPGCTNPAVVEFFCCEAHQAAWAKQFVVVPPSPFLLGAIAERMPVVREAVQAEMDRVVADIHTQVSQQQIVHTAPGSMVEDIQRAYELVRDVEPPEPVQLTRSQFDALQAANPPLGGGYPVDGALCGLLGVPVELVDTVEESTPHLLAERRRRESFHAALIGLTPTALALGAGALSAGVRSAVARAADAEQLTLHIRAVCRPDQLEEAMAKVDQRVHDMGMTRVEALKSVFDDLSRARFPSASATYPLVAPEDLQVAHSGMRGWLGRWIHRKRGA